MRTTTAALAALVALGGGTAAAQVVREDGTRSIAGFLTAEAPTAEWTFEARRGDILFASLSADVYRTWAGHEEEVVVEDPGGGCGDEGGAGRFYLLVLDANGVEICRAERPAPPPGWQRDPRMACVVPGGEAGGLAKYTVRVGLNPPEEHTEPLVVEGEFPFLVDLSLRAAAPSGIRVQEAIPRSRNRL